MINRILVANRGEIARRVFATCNRLGIETVAIYSDADAKMPFVAEADAAVRLPGNTPGETYLRPDLILDAARRAGADAIHPGYGFLSESAEFARGVEEANLIWIGPSPESIERMGSKVESKKIMSEAGVPVLTDLTPDAVDESDLPVLVKASAGGGGRGMRAVRALDALAGEVAAAQAEAESAFGDGTVFIEPYVERGRHVEVQVVGDGRDAVVLGTRDCSVQRRHQKVIEEAPAPGLPDATRQRIHAAARAAAQAVDYVGAGTVEFLYDTDRDDFFFLEMNTRLQVEHPVTEAVYGLDLVDAQIAVAEGRGLPAVSEPTGHAIEVRLYAEDPSQDYAPQTGVLADLTIDHDEEFALDHHGVRLDSGFVAGNEVSTFYDAMLAKVIAWAPTREQAARVLARRLELASLHGVQTNRDQLVQSLRHEAFLRADLATSFLADYPQVSQAASPDDLAPFAAAVALAEARRADSPVQQRIPSGFRTVVSAAQVTRFEQDGEPVDVQWYADRVGGYRLADRDDVAVASSPIDTESVRLLVNGIERRYRARVRQSRSGPRAVLIDGPQGSATLLVRPRFIDPAQQVAKGSLLAPMPGTVMSCKAVVDEEVCEGEPLVVMEAMKMQHTLTAPYDGTVTHVAVEPGQQVQSGAVLAVVTPKNVEDQGD